jgi:hypothetical protein
VRRALAFVAAAGLVALTILTQDVALERRSHFSAETDQLYLPRPSALTAMSLGHHELTADLVFVRALIYFGTQLSGTRDYRWLENYLDTIVKLDPQWRRPYRWAGVATMYDGRTITNKSVMQSSHFLELGAKQFPDDWELPFMLGCNYLFELRTDDPAQKAEWRRIGGEYVRHAALLGGAPPWVPLLAATILREGGDTEAAARHLEEVYLSTNDPATREEVRKRLMSIANAELPRIERERAAFEKTWLSTVPYVPADFFVVLQPAPSPRLDLPHLTHQELLDLPPVSGSSGDPARP